MLKVTENLLGSLFGLLNGKGAVGSAKGYSYGNALLVLADLRAAVDVKELNVLNKLSACLGNRVKDASNLKSLVAYKREVTCGRGVLEVGSIFDAVTKAGGKLVEDVKLFDIYRGAQVGENKKSVSIRVTLRAADRTLTVEETEKASKKILGDLEHKLGITLR